jgi:hypothetical protein
MPTNTRRPSALSGLDMTRPCIDLIDEVLDILIARWHEDNLGHMSEGTYDRLSERADAMVMGNLK